MHDRTENLLFETSPFGNVDAIVEHDGRAVFFYLVQHEQNAELFPTKACWVRNLTPGPLVISQTEMEQGIPPQLPRTHTRVPGGEPCPAPDQLHVIWFEEGNGAALCEVAPTADSSDQFDLSPLAVIPPWSGQGGFHGYAAGCASESPICWPMPSGAMEPLLRRLDAAREFWQSLNQGVANPFQVLQQAELDCFQQRFGEFEQYFSIDGGNFPPRGLIQFRDAEHLTLLTVAMALCPQPNVELAVDQPQWHRRIELGICLPANIASDTLQLVHQRISGIAAHPWNRFAWFGQGHTIDFLEGQSVGETSLEFAAFVSDSFLAEQTGSPGPNMPEFRGDPVSLLWMLPVSREQQAQIRDQKLLVEELL